jgi:hypothetical protein
VLLLSCLDWYDSYLWLIISDDSVGKDMDHFEIFAKIDGNPM